MPDNKKITDLGAASTLTGTELLECVQSAASKKATVNQIRAGLLAAAITSLNGLVAAVQTLTNADDTNVTLTITSVTDDHTFTLGWSGQLGADRGGTGLDASGAANGALLIGNGAGFDLATLTAGGHVTINNSAGGIEIVAGGFVESLNSLTAAVQTFTNADDTNVTLTITSVTDDHTFTLGWTGQLGADRGGTGLDASGAANGALLIGNGAGFDLATLTAGTNITINNTSGGIEIVAAGGSAGGMDTYVQYNTSGAFDGSAGFTFDESAVLLTVVGSGQKAELGGNASGYAGRFTTSTQLVALASATIALASTDGSNSSYLCNGTFAGQFNGHVGIIGGQLRTDTTAAATTLGSVVARLAVYDLGGSLIGYMPIYDSIT